MSNILSIQSAVAYGHVGNSAAVFPLQRMGHEVFPVLTVNYAASTVYGKPQGPIISAAQVAEVIDGVEQRGALDTVDAVLSGFQGSSEIGNVILDAVAKVKSKNPDAIYLADPVFGDVDRGFYVPEGIPEFLRDHIVPKADVVVPNLFELAFLTDQPCDTTEQTLEAVAALRERGPQTVLVTSAVTAEIPDTTMRMIAVSDEGAWEVETPMIDRQFTGSGDITAAVFLAELLTGESMQNVLSKTASVIYSVLKQTTEANSVELTIVQSQDEFVQPTYTFVAQPISQP